MSYEGKGQVSCECWSLPRNVKQIKCTVLATYFHLTTWWVHATGSSLLLSSLFHSI